MTSPSTPNRPDLDFVLDHIHTWTPGMDPEDDPGELNATDEAVYRAMCDLKHAILERKAAR